MRHLFQCWTQVSLRLRTARSIALFLDFDGTLTGLLPRPEDVQLKRATRNAVARLAGNPRLRVWVVSGRKRGDVRMRTRIPRVHYLGLHGWENGCRVQLSSETRCLLEKTKRTLATAVCNLRGIWLEDKGPVFSIHYRGASGPEVAQARSAVRAALAAAPVLRVIAGKQVWEILPAAIGDKGRAVQHELNLMQSHAVPIYVGDDQTDEPAFAALAQGITVRVGRHSLTRAKFQLRDTNEVRIFLEKLAAEIS